MKINPKRKRAQRLVTGRRTWLCIAQMFILLCILVWLDEILDLPHLLLGAPRTPLNWREAASEMILIAIVGFFAVSRLIHDTTERERAEDLNRIQHALALALNAVTDLDEALRLCVDAAMRISGLDCGGVYLVDEASGNIDLASHQGLPADFVNSASHYEADSDNARLIMAGEPVYSQYRELDTRIDEACYHEGLHAIAVIPIHHEGRVIACLNVASYTLDEVPVFARDALETTAAQVGSAIARVKAEEALEQYLRELTLLNQASQALVSTLDLDRVIVTILEETRRLLDVTACSVWLIDRQTDELVCRQATGPQKEIVHGWRLAPGQGIAGWVVRAGESLIVPDAWADERYFKGVDEQTGLSLRSILTVPLRVVQSEIDHSGVIGVLQVVDTKVARFQPTDMRLVESLATTAAIAIENAQLYQQARQDAKTRSVLIDEINHRVKNNLSAIIGLLYTERRYAGKKDQAAYQSIVQDLVNRVQGMATVHSLLSASEWEPLQLSELVSQVIRSSLQTLPRDKRVSVDVTPSPVRVTPNQAHDLALVINELATNTVKHTLQERDTAHISAHITLEDDRVLFEFRDDGPGYPEDVSRLERRSVGFDVIQNIVHNNLRGELSLRNDGGAVAIVHFQAEAGLVRENSE